MRVQLIVASVIALTLSAAIFAQPATSPELAAAAELIKQQKFDEAATAYSKIVEKDEKVAPAWYWLGRARQALKDYTAATAAYEKVIALGGNPFALYNLAAISAIKGDKERAIELLTKAVDEPRMPLVAINFADADLASIRDDARFAALKEKVDRKIRPCKYSAEARQFDFFVGDWVAFNPAGQQAGTSVIQSFADGCGVLENWTNGVGGSGGKSINFYDPGDSKWHQYWMGPDGNPQRYPGVFKDGALRFEGDPLIANGKTTLRRLTFFNIDANTVRQLFENSTDGGKSWTVGYDFKYVRRK